MNEFHLSFHVGQTVEARSFEKGFRGAWFQCKITSIFKKKNELFYKLEYLDFPGEKIHATKAYQKGVVGNKKHLMVRPKFPPIYHENEEVDVKSAVETILVVNETWKVGDLVDWWKDHCYWSGTVVEVMGDGKFKIELLPIPVGEGDSYEAQCSDMRPSLDWSPVEGWIVPSSNDGEERRCARLIKPIDQCKVTEDACGREEHIDGTTKKHKVDGSLPLNIMGSNAIEAAVLDLEELVARIKWLKAFLATNLEKSPSSSTTTSSWEFQEYCPLSTTRLRNVT